MKIFKYCYFLALLMSINIACENDVIDQDADAEEQLILDYLADLDYNLEDIEFKDGFVVYQSDAGWDKDDLLISIKNGEEIPLLDDPDAEDFTAATERQRVHSNVTRIITKQNVVNITYFIRASVTNDLNADWRDAVVDAAVVWSNVSYCRINMTRTYNINAADIIIGSDNDTYLPAGFLNLGDRVVGQANYPSNGAPGRFIAFNDAFANYAGKLTTAVHEFGHCLGFRHANGDAGNHIYNTPNADPNSVMKTPSLGASVPLDTGDEVMARTIYPESLNIPANFSASRKASGEVRINYSNPTFIKKPYYWVRAAKYSVNGQILAVRYFRAYNKAPLGEAILEWDGHQPGTYLFALRACNYKRDIWSHRTAQISVTL